MTVDFTFSANNTTIVGQLTRETVPTIKKNTIKTMLAQPEIIINLKEVTRADTAGLAWLFLVLEKAAKIQVTVQFSHICQDILNLAKLSGVEHLLPQQA
ncbi:STAS domain-containing protein [Thalassotalea sp. PLHSN55]|uniref:STAS domain-containing protein n=1 Tax=Thalassotalea sp. PLHSN55 TaxID=3435888 RepID=UPI003F85E331